MSIMQQCCDNGLWRYSIPGHRRRNIFPQKIQCCWWRPCVQSALEASQTDETCMQRKNETRGRVPEGCSLELALRYIFLAMLWKKNKYSGCFRIDMHKISYQCYAYIPIFYANKNLLTKWLLNTLGLKLLLVTHFVSNFFRILFLFHNFLVL